MNAKDRLIVAIDVSEPKQAYELTSQLAGVASWIKVGSVLFSLSGRRLVQDLARDGWNVFLDLKLHDVPYQVGMTVHALSDLGVKLATLHTSGGPRMMEAAAKAASEADQGLKLLGVTVLTSMDQAELESVGVGGTPAETVALRARLAQQSGLDGVVSSALEVRALRELVGTDFEIVTPGIRPLGVQNHDQKRVATPREAFEAGASRIVVGRAITQASDPAQAAASILGDLQ
jgi:orotidine-5'-phosphate decarboxylase